jgi:hypothetical protein
VTAYDGGNRQIGSATTNWDGTYLIQRLPAGQYRLDFMPLSGSAGAYVRQSYNGITAAAYVASEAEAAALAVPTIANVALTKGAQLYGMVTASDTLAGLAGVTVSVCDPAITTSCSALASGRTATDGTYYTTPGLPQGTYRVLFGANASREYRSTHGQPSPLFVTAGSTVRMDATLNWDPWYYVYLPFVIRR